LKPFEQTTPAPFRLHPLHGNFRPAAFNRAAAATAADQNLTNYEPFGGERHYLLY
jgi:hypothetical protein